MLSDKLYEGGLPLAPQGPEQLARYQLLCTMLLLTKVEFKVCSDGVYVFNFSDANLPTIEKDSRVRFTIDDVTLVVEVDGCVIRLGNLGYVFDQWKWGVDE